MLTRYFRASVTGLVILTFVLTACGGQEDDAPVPTDTTTATISPTSTAVVLLPETSTTSQGEPDNAVVTQIITARPGETFAATWQVRNTGDREWSDVSGAYVWQFVGGDPLGGPSQVPIDGTVSPGQEYEIIIELNAPEEPGTYEGRWQLHDPDGRPLGSEVGVRVKVSTAGAESPATEPATETSATDAALSDFVVQGEEPATSAEATSTTPDAEATLDTATPVEAPQSEAPATDGSAELAKVLEEGCLDALPVADVTIPDGSVLEPGESFTKIWRIRNAGSCDWDDGLGEFQWVFVNGHQMDGPSSVPIIGPVPAGGDYDVEMELTAPQEPGLHEGQWRVRAPNGNLIGVLFWVLIKVAEQSAATVPDSAPPSTGAEAPPPSDAPDMAQEIWQLINGERDRHHLYQLGYNEKLALAAQRHAEDCSQRGSCSHTGSDGSDEAVRVQRVGYQGSVDESWAMAMAASNAVAWWLDEVPPNDWHRRMLLTEWATEVGVGVAPAPAGYFFIAVFGITGH